MRWGLIVAVSGIITFANAADNKDESADHADADKSLNAFCNVDGVNCNKDEKGALQVNFGAFGKVVFGYISNREPLAIFDDCKLDAKDKRPDRGVDCSRATRLTDDLVHFAFKVPFTRSMRVDLANTKKDNAWWRERRTLRKMGQLGFSPKVLDVRRASNGRLELVPGIPRHGLLMEWVDGSPAYSVFRSLTEDVSMLKTPEEIWIRLRAMLRTLLLYVDYLGKMWHHEYVLRHCDAHWVNFLIRRAALKPEELNAGIKDGSVVVTGPKLVLQAGLNTTKATPTTTYRLVPSAVVGLDVSYSIRLGTSAAYRKMRGKMPNPCVYYSRRPDDNTEIVRSIATMAIPRLKKATATGQAKKMVDAVVATLESVMGRPTVSRCQEKSIKAWKSHSYLRQRKGAAAARAEMQQKMNSSQLAEFCTMDEEVAARAVVANGLLSGLHDLESDMPPKLKSRGFERTSLKLNSQGFIV